MVMFSSAQECESIEYKYIIQNDKFETKWEDGENRIVNLSKYFEEFNGQEGYVIVEDRCYGNAGTKARVYDSENEPEEQINSFGGSPGFTFVSGAGSSQEA